MDLGALLRRSPSPLTDLESDADEKISNPRKRARRPDDAPRRAPRRSGKLSLLPTMPLDVLLEIMGYLQPGDLLQLARTTKAWRALLLTKQRAPLWRRAYTLVHPCPPAPRWMSEPAWAQLVFGGSQCHMCGARPVRVHAALLKRVCRACLNANLITKDEAKAGFVFCLEPLFDELLSTIEAKLGGARTRPATYYWAADVQRVHTRVREIFEREFAADPRAAADGGEDGLPVSPAAQAALDKLHESVRARTAAHRKHAARFARWQAQADRARLEVLKRSKSSRRNEINKRLLALGYPPADVAALASHREVCAEQPLTPRVWKRVQPLLAAELARVKAERLARESAARRADRERAVGAAYDAWLCTVPRAAVPVAPGLAELLALPEFAAWVEEDAMVPVGSAVFPDEAFQALVPRLEAHIASTGRARHAEMLAARTNGAVSLSGAPAPSSSAPTDAPFEISPRFDPATTAFRALFGTLYFGREVLEHAGTRWPPAPVSATFDARAFGAVALLLDALGLPADAPPAALDAADPALVCTGCPLLERRAPGAPAVRGRLVLGWREAAAHRAGDHEPAWRALAPAERAGCAWDAPAADAGDSEGWVCARCAYFHARVGAVGTGNLRPGLTPFRRWGRRGEVERHLREVHGVEDVREGEEMQRLMLVRHQARARESVLWSDAAPGAAATTVVVDSEDEHAEPDPDPDTEEELQGLFAATAAFTAAAATSTHPAAAAMAAVVTASTIAAAAAVAADHDLFDDDDDDDD